MLLLGIVILIVIISRTGAEKQPIFKQAEWWEEWEEDLQEGLVQEEWADLQEGLEDHLLLLITTKGLTIQLLSEMLISGDRMATMRTAAARRRLRKNFILILIILTGAEDPAEEVPAEEVPAGAEQEAPMIGIWIGIWIAWRTNRLITMIVRPC